VDSKFERKVVAHFDNGVISIRTLDGTHKTVSETMKELLSDYTNSFRNQKSNVPIKMVFTTEEVKQR